ncbi:hypothetical protein O6H91_21G012700 [Diphasiastrum complanatum]|uniref:Uncharacterized protein n=2 Tax=Diphasiastrum complanatum TaxID=34168 RepID=A0ACC2AI23_DIPCM|nr:hypothetical protein O6H91_21G012700 [Diphasiastrum complanatum]KAJ7517167.1 hypothetical protein O6H91_21G012700 [Diphasiastrum complanatum]
MGRRKKASSNPYAERGLDTFSQLKSELTQKREEIAARIGAPLSEVRLTSASTPGVWIPVYPSSVVHSSASSPSSTSPRSGLTSPRSFVPAIIENEEKSDKSDHEEPPSEATPTFNTKNKLSRLGLSLSLLGLIGLLSGALYARRAGLFAQIIAPVLVFLISFYVLQSKNKASRLWIRQIFRSMRLFSGLGFDEQYSQDGKRLAQKELGQNSLPSSQSGMQPSHNSSDNGKHPVSSASAASVPSKSPRKAHNVPHRQEHALPVVEQSNATIHKPQSLRRSKAVLADVRLRDSGSVAASEKRSRSAKYSRSTRNAGRQDRLYGLLMMLNVALAGLAFGMVPGILCTATSWFLLPIMKVLIMSKDQGYSNAHTGPKINTVN